MKPYSRILLKLSGESLMGSQQYGIDPVRLTVYAEEIMAVTQMGVQIGIVIGGGNIFRGLAGTSKGFDRVKGDQMGMLATVINSLALQSAITAKGGNARVFTSIRMEPVGEYYSKEKAIEAMKAGEVAIIAGGTGNPYFTTDTAAVLRGIETGADAILKGTRVDGIYTANPEKVPDAARFETITFEEVYQMGLQIMDLTAITLCRENNLPLIVFNMDKQGNLLLLLQNGKTGTLVTN
jgi:uridylate kinase